MKKIDAELRIVDDDIGKLQERKTTLLKRKQALKEKANEEATKVDSQESFDFFLNTNLFSVSSIKRNLLVRTGKAMVSN